MNRLIRTLALSSLALAACEDAQPVETVPIDGASAALAVRQHAREHLDALLALSETFRQARWLPAEQLDPEGAVADALAADDDVAAEAADALAELLDEANVEQQAEKEVVYRVPPEMICGDDDEAAGCLEALARGPLRIRVTAPAEGDVDLELLVGDARLNPVDLALHADRIAVRVDLAAAAAAATLWAGPDPDGPVVAAAGIVHVAAIRNGPADYTLEAGIDLAVDLHVDADGEALDLSAAPSLASARLIGGAAPSVALDWRVGAVALRFVDNVMRCTDDACFDRGEAHTFAFDLPGLTGAVRQTEPTALAIESLGFAGPLTAHVDGALLLSFDPNPSRKAIDLTVSNEAEALDLRFDHAATLAARLDTDVLAEIDEEVEGEGVLEWSIAVNGNQPHLQVRDDEVAVLDGALRIERSGADPIEVRAGQCLADREEGPEVAACR